MERGEHVILVVDDEPANLRLIEKLLGRSGYGRVHGTTDPTRVTSLLGELCPDLIMLDLQMPELDGFGVMEELAPVIAQDYLPILVLTADATAATKHKALAGGANDFLTKPFDPAEVLARVGNLLDTRSLYLQLRLANETLEEKVAERTTALWETVGELEQAHQDLRLAQEETIHSLALAADFRDDETSRHIERMSRYCAVLAAGSALDDRRQETIRIASKMHDIGKIGVADAILRKPGKLTPAEFEAMKAHAQIGYDILSSATSELARTAAVIAWTHHERVEGTGYPRGLKHEDIPLEGRIAAVADVFDALTTDRVYRNAFSLPQALSIMRESSGTHLCPDILDVLFDRMDEILTLKDELDRAVT